MIAHAGEAHAAGLWMVLGVPIALTAVVTSSFRRRGVPMSRARRERAYRSGFGLADPAGSIARSEHPPRSSRNRSVPGAAALSLTAGAVHAGVAYQHAAASPAAGLFFVVVASVQIGWAISIVRAPSASRDRRGVAFQAGVVLLWLVSRTAGVPFGEHPWQAEPIGAADALATACEIAVIALHGSMVHVRARTHGPRVRG